MAGGVGCEADLAGLRTRVIALPSGCADNFPELGLNIVGEAAPVSVGELLQFGLLVGDQGAWKTERS